MTGVQTCALPISLMKHTSSRTVDACLINDAVVPEGALERYRHENSYPVQPDVDAIRALGCKAVVADLLGVNDYVRHDSKKLTKALIDLIETQRFIKR